MDFRAPSPSTDPEFRRMKCPEIRGHHTSTASGSPCPGRRRGSVRRPGPQGPAGR
jgi:hypothetical protein